MVHKNFVRSVFTDEVVVFSGRLSSVGRREAKVLVRRLGGVTSDEVNLRTTMLVVGGDSSSTARNLKKAEKINSALTGHVSILTEAEFCGLTGLSSPEQLSQRYYGLQDIRGLYPTVQDDHLRYLEKWGLIRSVVRTNSETYYSFSDLIVIRNTVAQVEKSVSFRTVVRALLAERAGQLAFDFQASKSDTFSAKVLVLKTRQEIKKSADSRNTHDSRAALDLAGQYFLEGSGIDDGTPETQVRAENLYRRALLIDPSMVAALVNLANIHYSRDQLIEAQALYERATKFDPRCFEAHFNLGNVHHALGRYEEAESCYEEALLVGPLYAEAHFSLAVTLEKMGRSREARSHWRAYRKLAPNGEWVELATEFSE